MARDVVRQQGDNAQATMEKVDLPGIGTVLEGQTRLVWVLARMVNHNRAESRSVSPMALLLKLSKAIE